MVGNGVTNYDYDNTNTWVESAFWHSLFDFKNYKKSKELACNFQKFDLDKKDCTDIWTKFAMDTYEVNLYNIFGFCYGLMGRERAGLGSEQADLHFGSEVVGGETKTFKKYFTHEEYTRFGAA